MTKEQRDLLIKAMQEYFKNMTKEEAQEFLQKTGMYDKDGNLIKELRNE